MAAITQRFFGILGSALSFVAIPLRRPVVAEPIDLCSTNREPELEHPPVLETWSESTDDAPVEPEQLSIEAQVDELFHQACLSYPTYEVMVNKAFAASMRRVFGDDEQGSEDAIKAFAYAREEFYYLSPDEEEHLDQENAANGICGHGLDNRICPRGCGEID
ncbi:hypothetical protein [Pseudomonas sp. EpS/L25]|uniref:hypothetical protein n=1 Tax=Pseudomonas sp. EpS/L25 TaxID=1749078 RepID=UPI0007434E84|nr:hypothetical protein [Pseudomonas sp. EpS/L25]KUM43726.1 hypothetical protein AR540_18260 [Pseudomonas sp. EpS/L25]